MATITRAELQAYFKNGMIPTAQHFKDLIDSTVNKKDDHFFGLWRPGIAYRDGDVVIYGKSMYMLTRIAPPGTDDPNGDPTKQTKSAAPAPIGGIPETYCSTQIPPKDNNWSQLDFDLEDDDWTVDPIKGLIFAKDTGLNAGIGTTTPCAKLHVEVADNGMLLFNRVDSPKSELLLIAKNYPDCNAAPQLWIQVDDKEVYAESTTKTGFRFGHADPTIQTAAPAAKLASVPHTLMVLTRGDNDEPQAGIGVDDPEAVLHVNNLQGGGDLLLMPSRQDVPTLAMRHQASGKQFSQIFDGNFAHFRTDAPGGFQFQPDAESSGDNTQNGGEQRKPIVSINAKGGLGVGTGNARTNLEVRNPECGSFQVSLTQIPPAVNPAMAIINEKPAGTPSYLTLGADNSYGVLKTDAPCGFVFKTGAAYGSGGNPERNINEGKDRVYIDQHGQVGIGTPPEHYELDVDGSARFLEMYLSTKHMHREERIEDALDLVCRLTPIRFQREHHHHHRHGGNEHTPVRQFGLYDYECADVVPEVVKIDGHEKAIAYQNLVPLLIRAIQEQQTMIDELSRRVTHLEKHHHHPGGKD